MKWSGRDKKRREREKERERGKKRISVEKIGKRREEEKGRIEASVTEEYANYPGRALRT